MCEQHERAAACFWQIGFSPTRQSHEPKKLQHARSLADAAAGAPPPADILTCRAVPGDGALKTRLATLARQNPKHHRGRERCS